MGIYSTPTLSNPFKRSLTLAFLIALSFYILVQLSAPGQFVYAAGTYSGTVFRDYNANEVLNTLGPSDNAPTGTTETDFTTGQTQGGTQNGTVDGRANLQIDFGFQSSAPTSADMGSVTAQANADGSVGMKWETLNETLIMGFNVLRSDSAQGTTTTLNAVVIPSQSLGENVGNTYSYTDVSAAANTTYYYWLEILRADGSSEQTQPIKVKTPANACAGKPDAATLLTPANGKQVKKAKVTFSWSAVNCAASYTWQLRADAKDGRVIASRQGLTTTTTSIKKLDRGRTYYWRVLACNANGKCTASDWWSILVKAAR